MPLANATAEWFCVPAKNSFDALPEALRFHSGENRHVTTLRLFLLGDFERYENLSPVAPRSYNFRVTKDRWAQIGITIDFLIVVRTLGEFFRLRHVLGANLSIATASPYVGGALIAACSCWAGVTFYFFRRYTLSASIALATVPVLLVFKIAVIGW